MSLSLLLVGQDQEALRPVASALEAAGHDVLREPPGMPAAEACRQLRPDVLVVDAAAIDGGIAVAGQLRPFVPGLVVLVGDHDADGEARALEQGADQVLRRDAGRAHLLAAVRRVADVVLCRRVNEALRRALFAPVDGELLGTSPEMTGLAQQVGILARSDRTTALLVGEPGTGKGVVAQAIHQLSARASGPFLRVNCAGASAADLDVQLFGRERDEAGARVTGLLDLADRGTLLFDEVGELAPELQPKLLKVIETRAFRRLGGTREITVDVRVMASSSQDLEAAVEAGRFREDLCYRLSAMPLTLPPLRERPREDRQALMLRLFEWLRAEIDGPATLTADALDRLLAYGWPGNLRELRNVLERALILARGQSAIAADHLPIEFRLRSFADRRHTPQTLDDLERQHIERTLRFHGGNRTRAAQELGISRATLINKIKRYTLNL